MDRLQSMRVFRRVVERHGFAAAARDLRVSTAAASKHVAALEELLGARLLLRNTRRVSTTTPGAAYYEHCVRILDEIDATDAALGRAALAPTGLLRVSVPLSFGLLHISPLLPELLAQYPDLKLDVSFSDRFIDLVEERVDVVLRIARSLPDSSSLAAQRLARTGHVLCASPEYVERRGAPRSPGELAQHECVTYALSSSPTEWSFDGPRGSVSVEVRGRLVVSNSLAVRDAVLAGAGIGLLPRFYVWDLLAQGRLVALLPGFEPPRVTVSAVYARGKTLAPKVRVLVDFLRARFSTAEWADAGR